MSKEAFLSFYKGTPNEKSASICYDLITQELKNCGIYSELALIGALATIRTEVGKSFLPIKEIASGQAYEGRKDLGNFIKGDGVKFKGRGYIQLTGRANYVNYGNMLGIDLVCNPDLALDQNVAAKIFTLYFKERKCNIACDQKDWVKVRKLVNGGNGIDKLNGGTTNGLNEFISIVNQYLAK